MRSAFRADGLAAEGSVLDLLDDIVRASAVIERAHDLEVSLAAVGTWTLVDDIVAGVALVPAFFFGYILQRFVFFCQSKLFLSPYHVLLI